MTNSDELETATICETENYIAYFAKEPDGETTYHLQLNNVTVHFYNEEWEEFLQLVREIIRDVDGK